MRISSTIETGRMSLGPVGPPGPLGGGSSGGKLVSFSITGVVSRGSAGSGRAGMQTTSIATTLDCVALRVLTGFNRD